MWGRVMQGESHVGESHVGESHVGESHVVWRDQVNPRITCG